MKKIQIVALNYTFLGRNWFKIGFPNLNVLQKGLCMTGYLDWATARDTICFASTVFGRGEKKISLV